MRALTILILLLSTIPTAVSDRPCTMAPSSWENPYYTARVPHEEIARPLTYTASPPATLIAQHYVTATLVLTYPHTTPPITYTIQTFEYSETTDILGYSPLIPRPSDYAYTFRATMPFQVYRCAPGASAHTFLPRISR